MANVLAMIDAFVDDLSTAGTLDDLAGELAPAGFTPAATTYGTKVPNDPSRLRGLYVQYGWDGTPTEADNRESAALRLTVWAPKGQPTLAADFAAALRDLVLYSWTSTHLWGVNRGTGRLPGTDPDTDLPFCTVTVYPQLRATTPALTT